MLPTPTTIPNGEAATTVDKLGAEFPILADKDHAVADTLGMGARPVYITTLKSHVGAKERRSRSLSYRVLSDSHEPRGQSSIARFLSGGSVLGWKEGGDSQ